MTSLMLEPVSGEGATPGELQAEEPRSNKEHLGVGAWLAIAWLALMLVFAVLGEHLGLPSKNDFNPRLKLAPPFTAGHLLGTDNVGHDMLAYVVYGTKVSVGVGVISVAIGTVIGGFFGLISGYFRNIFTVGLGYMFDVLLAFPPLVLSLTLVTVLAYDPAGSEWRRFAAVVAASPSCRSRSSLASPAPTPWCGPSGSSSWRPRPWAPRAVASSFATSCPTSSPP